MDDKVNINHISSYLFRIAKNCAIDEFKRKGVERRHSQYSPNKDIYQIPPQCEVLIKLLEELEETEKNIIIFHIILGETFEESSKILNMSVSKTKRIFYKALENLRILYFAKVNA